MKLSKNKKQIFSHMTETIRNDFKVEKGKRNANRISLKSIYTRKL